MDILFTKKQIDDTVKHMATSIDDHYHSLLKEGQPLVMLCNMKGALFFFSDLLRKMKLPEIAMDTVQTSSYSEGTSSSEVVEIIRNPAECYTQIENQHVLIVDDILDTGKAMTALKHEIEIMHPKSIKTCVLVNKHERRTEKIIPDFKGFDIDKGYLVGYGMSVGEKERRMDSIYTL